MTRYYVHRTVWTFTEVEADSSDDALDKVQGYVQAAFEMVNEDLEGQWAGIAPIEAVVDSDDGFNVVAHRDQNGTMVLDFGSRNDFDPESPEWENVLRSERKGN